MKARALCGVATIALLIPSAMPGTVGAQTPASARLQPYPVQGAVSILAGGPVNITVQKGEDGVLLVDAPGGVYSDQAIAALKELSPKPLRYIVNTTMDAEHVAGNESIARVGRGFTGVVGLGLEPQASVLAHENMLQRMSGARGGETATATGIWPNLPYVGKRKDLFLNDETVQVIHMSAAHTDSDSIVFFRKSDVISAGDVYITTGYPVIGLARGGTIDGVIAALNYIIELTNPRFNQEGGTMVIPGHGRISDEADVVEYRDMVTIVRARIAALAAKGSTLAQVKAARPTLDYDARYGDGGNGWTPDKFIEAIYQNVSKRK